MPAIELNVARVLRPMCMVMPTDKVFHTLQVRALKFRTTILFLVCDVGSITLVSIFLLEQQLNILYIYNKKMKYQLYDIVDNSINNYNDR